MKALITTKLGMVSSVGEDGAVTAMTLLSAEPVTITQLKSVEKDGYTAVQVARPTSKKQSKPMLGHLKKSKVNAAIIREFTVAELTEDLAVGNQLTSEVFSVGDKVKVTALSKGKGWAGTIKRHNFHRGRKTHGGRSYRRPGSIGSMYPQHIFKGTKMAGQMGHTQVTISNLEVAYVDAERNLLGVKGAVPGPKKGIVLVKGAKS